VDEEGVAARRMCSHYTFRASRQLRKKEGGRGPNARNLLIEKFFALTCHGREIEKKKKKKERKEGKGTVGARLVGQARVFNNTVYYGAVRERAESLCQETEKKPRQQKGGSRQGIVWPLKKRRHLLLTTPLISRGILRIPR